MRARSQRGCDFDTPRLSRLGALFSSYAGATPETYRREAFQTPETLRLLEERLIVNKERFVAGSVSVGKRVETHQENVSVALQREEILIERRAITDARPVEGVVFGAREQTFQVDLEAERANVSKQAYVVEEVTVGKRAVTDTQTVTETVGREVLDVTKTGDVQVTTQGQSQKLHLHRTKKALPDARVWECRSHSLSGSAPAF